MDITGTSSPADEALLLMLRLGNYKWAGASISNTCKAKCNNAMGAINVVDLTCNCDGGGWCAAAAAAASAE